MPRDLIIKDLVLMKQSNFNAIRTCHYPSCIELYNLCDRLGFYGEIRIELGGWQDKKEGRLIDVK